MSFVANIVTKFLIQIPQQISKKFYLHNSKSRMRARLLFKPIINYGKSCKPVLLTYRWEMLHRLHSISTNKLFKTSPKLKRNYHQLFKLYYNPFSAVLMTWEQAKIKCEKEDSTLPSLQ